MKTIKSYELPMYLIPFKPLIDLTTKESIKMQFSKETPTILNSKIGGVAYREPYTATPKDCFGDAMELLIQVNFDEFQLSEPFPSKGLLQIYVNKEFGNTAIQKGFDQYYIKFIDSPLPVHSHVELSQEAHVHIEFPIQKQLKIIGDHILEPVSSLDYRYNEFFSFDKLKQITEDERTFEEVYFETFLGAEHKIGGYPYFIENDFRISNPELKKYDTLLLQLVTDDANFINYRDSGIISFFIESDQLAKCNFTNVYMHVEEY